MRYYDRDIVVLDFETSGVWPDKGADPLTLGAVRVDGKTLETVASFHTEIKPHRPDQVSKKALEVNGLDIDRLVEEAPPAVTAVTRFERDIFGINPHNPNTWPQNIRSEVYLCSWNTSFDVERFMNCLLDVADRNRGRYGYHHLDLWTIAAYQFAVKGLPWPEHGLHFDEMCRIFGLDRDEEHSALQDALFGAEVFRRLHQPGELEHAWADAGDPV